jgi:hypothetical protein
MNEELGTTPEAEAPEVPLTPETEVPAPDDSNPSPDDAEQPDETPDFEEVDFKGSKYKVPKDLAPIIAKAENLESGVTRRFQEAAEIRKAAEAERQSFQLENQLNNEVYNELVTVREIENRLSQFSNVNWQAWQQQDPQAANAAMAEMIQLQTRHQQAHQTLNSKRAEVGAMLEQRNATQLSQSIEALNKADPDKGWSGKFTAKEQQELTKFASELGFSQQRLSSIVDPLEVKVMNLARIGLEMLKKQKATAAPPKVAMPAPQVQSGKTRSTVDPDKMSPEEWAKWRNEQVRRRK